MKLLDIQEKSKSNRNEVIYPKYPVTRIPHHTNQFAHRQQYGRWNWRNDQSQHPDIITGSTYNVYSPQLPSPSYHHPILFSSVAAHASEKPTITATTSSFATGCSIFLPPSKNP
ncbi:hypothetical protein TNCV_1377141 [Trichonephila clavipes]|nr:hypothetical protein TNCV_1377141 [Trichonephila clavipes]